MDKNDSLTMIEAYASMYAFLETLYLRTKSDDLGALLGGMSFLEGGGTADPAVWDEWQSAVLKVKEGKHNIRLDLR